MPAGSTIGQAATHLPQRVQASSVSSTRVCSASRNGDPLESVIVDLDINAGNSCMSLSPWSDHRNAQQHSAMPQFEFRFGW